MSLKVAELYELKDKLFEYLKHNNIDVSFRAAGLLVDIAKIDIISPEEKPPLAEEIV